MATSNSPVVWIIGGVHDGLDHYQRARSFISQKASEYGEPPSFVGAEWDRDAPPYMAQALFPLLVNSPGKRYVALAEGTHTIIMEKNRLKLFEAVQAFLDEQGRS